MILLSRKTEVEQITMVAYLNPVEPKSEQQYQDTPIREPDTCYTCCAAIKIQVKREPLPTYCAEDSDAKGRESGKRSAFIYPPPR